MIFMHHSSSVPCIRLQMHVNEAEEVPFHGGQWQVRSIRSMTVLLRVDMPVDAARQRSLTSVQSILHVQMSQA